MHAQGRPGLQILGQAEETINVPIALPLTEWMQIARFAAQDGRSVVEYVRAMVHTVAVSEDPRAPNKNKKTFIGPVPSNHDRPFDLLKRQTAPNALIFGPGLATTRVLRPEPLGDGWLDFRGDSTKFRNHPSLPFTNALRLSDDCSCRRL